MYSQEQDNCVAKDESIYTHLLRSFQSYQKSESSFASCIGNICPVINFITKEFLKQGFNQYKDFTQQLNERLELLHKWKAFIFSQFPEPYSKQLCIYNASYTQLTKVIYKGTLDQAICADKYDLYQQLNNTTIVQYYPTAKFIIETLDFLQNQKIIGLTYFTQQADFIKLIPQVADKELCIKLLRDYNQHDHEHFKQFLSQFNQGLSRSWLIESLLETKNHRMLLHFGDIPDILNVCLENDLSYSIEFVTLWIDRFSMKVLQDISEHESYATIAESLAIYPKSQFFLKLIHGDDAKIEDLGALPFQYFKWFTLLKNLSNNI